MPQEQTAACIGVLYNVVVLGSRARIQRASADEKNPSSKQKIIEEGKGLNLAYIELNPLNESYDPKSKTNTEVMLDNFKKDRLEEAAKISEKIMSGRGEKFLPQKSVSPEQGCSYF